MDSSTDFLTPRAVEEKSSSVLDYVDEANHDRLVVIRFHEAFCKDCPGVGKIYEGMVQRYPQVLFLDANLETNQDVMEKLAIGKAPSFIAFKNKEEVGRYVGNDPDKLEALIKENLK